MLYSILGSTRPSPRHRLQSLCALSFHYYCIGRFRHPHANEMVPGNPYQGEAVSTYSDLRPIDTAAVTVSRFIVHSCVCCAPANRRVIKHIGRINSPESAFCIRHVGDIDRQLRSLLIEETWCCHSSQSRSTSAVGLGIFAKIWIS